MEKALRIIQKKNSMYLNILEDNSQKIFDDKEIVFIGQKIKKIKWLNF